MRKFARRLAVAGLVGALVTLASFACVYLALWREPQFYREIVAQQLPSDSGQRFERVVLDLHNQAQRIGRWEARFAQDEINGWLAIDLPTKFPGLLPDEISEPRVTIGDDKFFIAARYRSHGVATVVSVTGEAYLTPQSNEVALRVIGAHAGALPIPIARFLTDATQHAARAGWSLRWGEQGGSPVVLLRLPLDHDDRQRQLLVDQLRCVRGEITLAGHTQDRQTGAAAQSASTQPADKEQRQR
jgi:hypothetical protein